MTNQLNDCILTAVGATGESDINDGLVAHYQANGATSSNLNDAEVEFLVANGATPGRQVQDMWKQLLPPVVGFDGQLNDMLLPFWCAGGTFAPPDAPAFNPTPPGQDPWPTSFEAFEEAGFSFDARPYFADGGFISMWSLTGDVPPWMSISNSGIITGTPPFDDVNYGAMQVVGNNATGPAASSDDVSTNTPQNVRVTFSPQTQFGEIGQPVKLVAQASIDPSASVDYQWYRNNSPISGANGFVYNLPSVAKADDGAEYFCECEGVGGVKKNTTKAQIRTMQTYNNNADGSGQLVRSVTLAAGLYVLSMSGTGLVELRELTANIIGIG